MEATTQRTGSQQPGQIPQATVIWPIITPDQRACDQQIRLEQAEARRLADRAARDLGRQR